MTWCTLPYFILPLLSCITFNSLERHVNLAHHYTELYLEHLEKTKIGRMDLTKRCWSQKAQNLYKKMNDEIKNEQKISIFKTRCKDWIKLNVPALLMKEDD